MKIRSLIRSFVGVILFTLITVILSTFVLFFSNEGQGRVWQNRIITLWAKSAFVLFGVDLIVEGLEKVPRGSALFIFNHSSFFDIFAISAATSNVRFGAKIELFKIPFFGAAMKRCGVLPIARRQKEEVFKVYAEAQERTARGEKFALAPEGGRNTNGQLLPFKAGPFVFAINAKMPLVPTVVMGAYEVMKKGQLFPNSDATRRRVKVAFLEPIPVDSVSLESRQSLQVKAFHQMKDYLDLHKDFQSFVR